MFQKVFYFASMDDDSSCFECIILKTNNTSSISTKQIVKGIVVYKS